MLNQANLFNDRLEWGFQRPITTNQITSCSIKPVVLGIEGEFIVNDRYWISIVNGQLANYSDENHSGRIQHEIQWWEKLNRATNDLTKETAVLTARDFLHKLNLTEDLLGLVEPPTVVQWDGEGGKPLPFFELRWRCKNDLERDPDYFALRMQVSGLTKKVVYFAQGLWETMPRFPTPTNWYQIIGIPSTVNTNWSSTNPPPKLDLLPLQWRKESALKKRHENLLNYARSRGLSPLKLTNAVTQKVAQ